MVGRVLPRPLFRDDLRRDLGGRAVGVVVDVDVPHRLADLFEIGLPPVPRISEDAVRGLLGFPADTDPEVRVGLMTVRVGEDRRPTQRDRLEGSETEPFAAGRLEVAVGVRVQVSLFERVEPTGDVPDGRVVVLAVALE